MGRTCTTTTTVDARAVPSSRGTSHEFDQRAVLLGKRTHWTARHEHTTRPASGLWSAQCPMSYVAMMSRDVMTGYRSLCVGRRSTAPWAGRLEPVGHPTANGPSLDAHGTAMGRPHELPMGRPHELPMGRPHELPIGRQWVVMRQTSCIYIYIYICG